MEVIVCIIPHFFVGMDVHKENFTVCCYDMIQDKIFYTQKLEPDYNQILQSLTFVGKNRLQRMLTLYAVMRLGASGLHCITS